jgi:PST family polysaccharide transporter
MGTDFYPRLTAVAHDSELVNRYVNEQTEIGIHLALPGLLATLVFAPWLMHLFYSVKFLPGAELLPWFVVGVFGQVIIFPLGFIQRAKGAVRWIYLGQTEANGLHLVFCFLLISLYGMVGVGYAFALHTLIHGVVVLLIAVQLTGFAWDQNVRKLMLSAVVLVILGCGVKTIANSSVALGAGMVLVVMAAIQSLRGIATKLGTNHRIIGMACKIPLGRLACGL